MANAVLTPLGYEDGFRRGLVWAAEAPVSELQELVESTRSRGWTTIPVRDEWTTLRVEFAPLVDDEAPRAVLGRDPFVVGFVESASYLYWDPESVDDGFTD